MSVSNVSPLNIQSTTGNTDDLEFERSLFQLMGRLEQILVRLDTVSPTKKLPGSVEIGKEILVELVEFSENHSEKDRVKALIDQVCDFHDHTKRFEKLLGGQSWNGIAAFIGIKTAYTDEAKAMFQQLGNELIETLGNFFRQFEAQFNAEENMTEWQSNSKVFLDDLIRRWNAESRS